MTIQEEIDLEMAVRDLADHDRQALARAIDKRACWDLWDFFDERDVRENARVWCEKVMNEDPTTKLRNFRKALRQLCRVYDRRCSSPSGQD